MKKSTKILIAVALVIVVAITVFVGIVFFSILVKWPQERPQTPKYALEITILSMKNFTEEHYRLEYGGFVNVSYFVAEVKINNIGQKGLYVSYSDFFVLTKDNEKIDPIHSDLYTDLASNTWISGEVKFDLGVNYDFTNLDKLVFDLESLYLYHIYEEWDIIIA